MLLFHEVVKVLLHHCEKILAEAQEARTALSEMQSELTGRQVPADLLRHSCIVLRQQLDDELWTFREANGTCATINSRVLATDLLVARDLALCGLGFVILPHAYCKSAVDSGQLVRVLPKWHIPPLVPAATYVERRYVPTRIRAFLDTVAAQFQQDAGQAHL
jgi:DNA-binding transcriptional LysR family regulator